MCDRRQGVPASKSSLFLEVFAEMTPTGSPGLELADWLAYIDVVVATRALKADLKTFFEYADLDGSGGERTFEVHSFHDREEGV